MIVRGIHTFIYDPCRIVLLGGLVYVEPYSMQPLDELPPIRMHFGKIKSARERFASDEFFRNCPNVLPIVLDFVGRRFESPLTAHWIDPGTGKALTLAWYENEQELNRARERHERVDTPTADERCEWGKTMMKHSADNPR